MIINFNILKMKTLIFISLLFFQVSLTLLAQNVAFIPDLSKINDTAKWQKVNRNFNFNESVYLDSKPGDGLLILKGYNFKNGRIELDIRGKDDRGKSFVGFAFHGLNDSTYEAVYFRPFNFQSAERSSHSVQYISHPMYTWYLLREKHPNMYENIVNPVPDPNNWFNATIIIEYPVIKVFVNNSTEPSLSINQLGSRKEGWIGFWVGNFSEGWFKNLKITSN
jgi:hypothetical protein